MWHRLFIASLLLFTAGCSSPGGTINFVSDSGRTFTASFGEAYISHSLQGDSDLVLIDNGEPAPAGNSTKPLEATPIAPLQQMMKIHLYWQPPVGTAKNPAAINASIDWLVLGRDGSADMLIYQGSGFVVVDTDGEIQKIRIRDGEISPKLARGQIQDPIGLAHLTGHIAARLDDNRVRDAIAQMQQQMQPPLTGSEKN